MPPVSNTPDDEGVLVLKDESAIVDRWRLDQFLSLGFDLLDAQLLTSDRSIEIRKAEKILRDGATHYVALRILL